MTCILLNPHACAGKAKMKWNRICSLLPFSYELHDIVSSEVLKGYYSRGVRTFIAAGGDGTVNNLLNMLLQTFTKEDMASIALGAIGLGSSNDFHKPTKRKTINGIPCCIEAQTAAYRDVLSIKMHTAKGEPLSRFALLNASCGITAEANAFFNSSGSFLKFLKRCSTSVAISYAIVRTLLCYRNLPMQMCLNEQKRTINLSNIGVVKSANFAGDLYYNTKLAADDGLCDVHVCDGLTHLQLIRTLRELRQPVSERKNSKIDRFCLLPGESCTLVSHQPFFVEFDGEIESVTSVSFQIEQKKVRCCG